jgi:hypothetical protein
MKDNAYTIGVLLAAIGWLAFAAICAYKALTS